MMNDASQLMTDTLNGVLSLQKLREGSLILELIPFNIIDSIHKVIAALSNYILSKNIKINVTKTTTIPQSILGKKY